MLSLKGPFTYPNGWNREWLLGNGLGGYASSSVIAANTRKYHGLLVASKNPPVERRLLLSKLEDSVIIGGTEYPLSANKYPGGVVYPAGHEQLRSFSLDPFPTFVYQAAGASVKKTVFTIHGRNATVVRYEINGKEPIELRIRPLVNDRDFHGNTHSKDGFSQVPDSHRTVVKHNDSTSVILESDSCDYSPAESWYENMVYDFETFRGEDDRDNHFCPGLFSARVEKNSTINIIATDGDVLDNNPEHLFRSELLRAQKISEKAAEARVPEQLLYAADTFLVRRKSTSSSSIIAGYHWFADWGRDSMIALPGLTLYTGRFDFAQSVLDTFSQYVFKGMVPNVFSDTGASASYNSADSSLWFILSSSFYLEKTGDEAFFRKRLWEQIKQVLQAHVQGTEGVRMESDNLLSCAPGLTWMDSFVDGAAVTPRSGKPVEVNALWYNALKIVHGLADRFGEHPLATETEHLSRRVKNSFLKFWNEEKGCLYDVLDPADASIRPNQTLAISLPHRILSKKHEASVLAVVERELLTPYGLRSLSQSDARYSRGYSGDRGKRDLAYHNGTVWSWLVGPYADACFNLGRKDEAADIAERLKVFIDNRGLGTVPELFEAESLEPRGCFSQAWGVAEWLRTISKYGR